MLWNHISINKLVRRSNYHSNNWLIVLIPLPHCKDVQEEFHRMHFSGLRQRDYIGRVSIHIQERQQHVHHKQEHLDQQIMVNWQIQSIYLIYVVLFLQLLVKDQWLFVLMHQNYKIIERTSLLRLIVEVRMQTIVDCWLVRHQHIGLCKVVLEQIGVWRDMYTSNLVIIVE
jgi:hypothetical protein